MADNAPEPMGGQQFEEKNPTGYDPMTRNCWAIDVLIEEVKAVFTVSGTTHNPSRFGANLTAVFKPDSKDMEDVAALLPIIGEEDTRIEFVEVDEKGGTITVKMWDEPISMDTRDPFGIVDASMGLDRQITPDDMTALAADLASGGEGFIEGGSY